MTTAAISPHCPYDHATLERMVRTVLASDASFSALGRQLGVSRTWVENVAVGKRYADVLPSIPRRLPRNTTCLQCRFWTFAGAEVYRRFHRPWRELGFNPCHLKIPEALDGPAAATACGAFTPAQQEPR